MIYSSRLIYLKNYEAPAPTNLYNQTKELGIYGAVVALVSVARDSNILEALLLLRWCTKNMAELGCANAAKSHSLLRFLALSQVKHFES